MAGWYRMHRGWMEHPVFQREPLDRRGAFIWLIEHAAFDATRVRAGSGWIELSRGQLSYSLRYLAAAWEWTEPKVRRFLKATQDANIIDASADAGQMVITICNYEKYQSSSRGADAGADTQPTHPPRVADANIKNEKEGRIEEGAHASARGRRGQYAFAGQIVRLTTADLERWRAAYHAIPDLKAELTSIDVWWTAQPAEKRKAWFHATVGMLNRRHQEQLAAKRVSDARPAGGEGSGAGADVHSFVDAFIARQDAPTRAPLSTQLKLIK